MSNAAGYIAIANGLVWGVGLTEADALTDMQQEAAKTFHDEDAPSVEQADVIPASSRLLDLVRDWGGDCGWVLMDGVACTELEAEDAQG